MTRLTKRIIDDLRPHPDRDILAWDGELRGFGVRIKPSGAGTFIVQYRNSEGRSRRVTLGPIGVFTPEEARKLARGKLGDVARGSDPAEEKRATRAQPTVAEICDWYLEKSESGELLGRRRRPIAKATLALDRSRINTHVRQLIGNRVVGNLSVADLERFQADISAGKTAKPRKGSRGGTTTGGPGVAGRTLGMLHTIFEQAARLRLIQHNPAKGVRKVSTEGKLERHLSAAEIAALGEAMCNATEESPVALAAIRFMLLTGFRRMEVLALERAWVDTASCCVRFPRTKSGPQLRVIGSTAVKLLKQQKQHGDNRYVFPSEVGDGHFVGLVRVLQRVCAAAQLEEVTLHVLRHTFASVAGDLGFSELTIAGLLGHSARGVTQRYVHLDRALILAADKVAEEIEHLMDNAAGKKRPHTATSAGRGVRAPHPIAAGLG